MRVEIPAYSNMWMRGARYGTVIGQRRQRANEVRGMLEAKLLYRVQLDKAPNMKPTLCYVADDCTIVD